MRSAVLRYLCVASIMALPLLPANAATALVDSREGDVHNHHFYSGRYTNSHSDSSSDNFIAYLVCNQTNTESDFFWAKATFGVGENHPLPANHCLERDDYIDGKANGAPPTSDIKTSNIYVRDMSGELPTIIWCDYLSIDRCINSFPTNIVSWFSELRMFGQGQTRDVAPIMSAGVRVADGKYRVEVQYSEAAGLIVVVARSVDVNTASFENADNQALKAFSVTDAISLDDSPISSGISPTDAAIVLPSAADTGGFYSFKFSVTDGEASSLSFLSSQDKQIRLRFDSSIRLAPLN